MDNLKLINAQKARIPYAYKNTKDCIFAGLWSRSRKEF
jgi:hypothetical protein